MGQSGVWFGWCHCQIDGDQVEIEEFVDVYMYRSPWRRKVADTAWICAMETRQRVGRKHTSSIPESHHPSSSPLPGLNPFMPRSCRDRGIHLIGSFERKVMLLLGKFSLELQVPMKPISS